LAVPRRRDAALALTDENRRVLRFALQLLRSEERPPSHAERQRLQDALHAVPGAAVIEGMVALGTDGYASPAIAGMDEMAIREIERLLQTGFLEPRR
jgi:uncharacterized membrane protein